jgi:hypothetical protein
LPLCFPDQTQRNHFPLPQCDEGVHTKGLTMCYTIRQTTTLWLRKGFKTGCHAQCHKNKPECISLLSPVLTSLAKEIKTNKCLEFFYLADKQNCL